MCRSLGRSQHPLHGPWQAPCCPQDSVHPGWWRSMMLEGSALWPVTPRLYFSILFCALLFQGPQASAARSCFWKECRVLPSDSHFIFWNTQSDRQQTDNPSIHQIRWWVPEVSSAWKVGLKNVGLGVPWVAAFLDSFSEGNNSGDAWAWELSFPARSRLSGEELGQQLRECAEEQGSRQGTPGWGESWQGEKQTSKPTVMSCGLIRVDIPRFESWVHILTLSTCVTLDVNHPLSLNF